MAKNNLSRELRLFLALSLILVALSNQQITTLLIAANNTVFGFVEKKAGNLKYAPTNLQFEKDMKASDIQTYGWEISSTF